MDTPTKTPLLVDARRIRPILDKKEWDVACAHCTKEQARWQFRPIESEGWLFMCSLCWLYESEWGKNKREHVDVLVADVGAERGSPLQKSDSGVLTDVREADALLGSVVALSRVLEIRAMMRAS